MAVFTHYELRKDGYIEEDGREVFDEYVTQAKTIEELIEYAKKNGLNPDDHFINTCGYEKIAGIKVPEVFNPFPMYLNQLTK